MNFRRKSIVERCRRRAARSRVWNLILENHHVVELAAAACALLLLTGAGIIFRCGSSRMSLAYLFAVLALTLRLGKRQVTVIFAEAVVCDALFFGVASLNHFADEYRHLAMLALLYAVLLTLSHQAGRARQMTCESGLRGLKLQRLFAVSRGALLLDLNASPERQMAELISREFDLQAVAIVHETMGTSGAAGVWKHLGDDLEIYRLLGLEQVPAPAHSACAISTPLRNSRGLIGTLLVSGAIDPLALESLGSLVALVLERHASLIREGVAEAARQTEQLRSTVLDGLAHAFKTPLTIIRAASSGLLDVGGMTALQAELTQMIDEQSAQLDELATRLLQTASLREEHVRLQLEEVDVAELVQEVVKAFERQFAALAGDLEMCTRIDSCVPRSFPSIQADHDLLRTTLLELLDNAVKYSEVGTPVSISAQGNEGGVLLSVHSWGEVIELKDRKCIFERYYRGLEQRHSVPGTGIGLSVARCAAEAHQGQIWVVSNEAEGTTFHVSLPRDLTANALGY